MFLLKDSKLHFEVSNCSAVAQKLNYTLVSETKQVYHFKNVSPNDRLQVNTHTHTGSHMTDASFTGKTLKTTGVFVNTEPTWGVECVYNYVKRTGNCTGIACFTCMTKEHICTAPK